MVKQQFVFCGWRPIDVNPSARIDGLFVLPYADWVETKLAQDSVSLKFVHGEGAPVVYYIERSPQEVLKAWADTAGDVFINLTGVANILTTPLSQACCAFKADIAQP